MSSHARPGGGPYAGHAAEWVGVACSAWVGGMSHVLLDAITHGNHSGWLVPILPVLRTPVPHLGGQAPLHDALQLWLTVAFALASLYMWRVIARDRLLWQWRKRPFPRVVQNRGMRGRDSRCAARWQPRRARSWGMSHTGRQDPKASLRRWRSARSISYAPLP